MDKDEEYEAFKLVWEEWSSKVAGADGWAESDRHYKTMMAATLPNSYCENIQLFTPSTLAFMATLYEGNLKKWMATYRWKKDNPGQNIPDNNKPNRANQKYKDYKDMFFCPYIRLDAGQNGEHGWTKEGLERFKVLQDEIKALFKDTAKKAAMEEVDQNFLRRLRTELGLDAPDADQERKRKRKRKRTGEAVEETTDVAVETFNPNDLDF